MAVVHVPCPRCQAPLQIGLVVVSMGMPGTYVQVDVEERAEPKPLLAPPRPEPAADSWPRDGLTEGEGALVARALELRELGFTWVNVTNMLKSEGFVGRSGYPVGPESIRVLIRNSFKAPAVPPEPPAPEPVAGEEPIWEPKPAQSRFRVCAVPDPDDPGFTQEFYFDTEAEARALVLKHRERGLKSSATAVDRPALANKKEEEPTC